MKKIIILTILLLINCYSSQSKRILNVLPITKNNKLGFYSYDKEFKMYQEPVILNKGKKYKIKGYDVDNYSEGKILSLSPNKKYIVLDNVIKGYVDDGINKTLYENYLCVIIDINKTQVVMEMQEKCGGNWNKKNQWIYGDKVEFNGK
ncbi:hypothetical protein VUJ46_19090 [Chryseobacterium sp. MYb264]|uniref:hypothetical protein n=1 Tax=Chryseobacterium sp. MYb264 TaxID=2745153 RepID=UPI002E0E0CEE|nr:hypothetical protein VUJ46_19090 [Chryseobacterium sp. MYb264]